jgi:hypothetical protein
MTSLITAIVLSASTPSLEVALQKALMRSPARVEVKSWEAPLRCNGSQFIPAPFESSGRVAVKVRGKSCEAWGWAHVRVIVPVATLLRDVKANESLDGAWDEEEREVSGGEVLERVPVGATATRSLRRGGALAFSDVRVGPKPGTNVTVRVVIGALSLEQRGTVSACKGLSTCATLPSGKKVAGVWDDGVLVVGGAL